MIYSYAMLPLVPVPVQQHQAITATLLVHGRPVAQARIGAAGALKPPTRAVISMAEADTLSASDPHPLRDAWYLMGRSPASATAPGRRRRPLFVHG
eukprot:COSAG03_NODE_7188_length_952_cov_1.774912_2_plen_95_part_01